MRFYQFGEGGGGLKQVQKHRKKTFISRRRQQTACTFFTKKNVLFYAEQELINRTGNSSSLSGQHTHTAGAAPYGGSYHV